jgi:AraC-like DNA-binding protein
MDFTPFMISKKLLFSPAGEYLVDFPPEFPFRLNYYDFAHPHAAIPNYHDHLEIAYIYRGSGVFAIGGRDYPAEEGDIFVINNGVFHLLEGTTNRSLKVVTLYFHEHLFCRYGSSETDFEYLLLFHPPAKGLKPRVTLDQSTRRKVLVLLRQIAEELKAQADFHRIAVKNCLCQILLLLNRAAGVESTDGDAPSLRMRDASRLKPVFDFIHERYCNKLALKEISAASNMSVSHLCRYFKNATGQTVTGYIKRFRVDRAKELLIEDERSITWIAQEVGFESHSYFDRIFHEVTRMTPQAFRRRFAPKLRLQASSSTTSA